MQSAQETMVKNLEGKDTVLVNLTSEQLGRQHPLLEPRNNIVGVEVVHQEWRRFGSSI